MTMTPVTREICRLFPPIGIAYLPMGKTATSTIKRLLMEMCGIDTADWPLARVHAEAKKRFPAVTHEEALRRGFVTFGFVRNPFDRLVSVWSNKVYDPHIKTGTTLSRLLGVRKGLSFSDFVAKVEKIGVLAEGHLPPQTYYIGQQPLSFMGRHEHLPSDWKALQALLPKIPDLGPPENQRPFRGAYRDLYHGDLRERVERLYKDDLDLLGYSF